MPSEVVAPNHFCGSDAAAGYMPVGIRHGRRCSEGRHKHGFGSGDTGVGRHALHRLA